MKVKIVVAGGTADYTEEWRARFAQACPDMQVMAWHGEADPPAADYAVVWQPPEGFFAASPGLKAVFNLGAGVDRLMTMPDLPASLPVVRVEDAGMGSQMAEYVLHGLIHASRQFDRYAENQARGQWLKLPAISYEAWPVGVMGLGAIGKQVAETLARAGYPVAGWSRSPKTVTGVRTFHADTGFQDFLARTRVLVNVLPLTPSTENIINQSTLQALLPDAYVINVARGHHLVDEDLLSAIDAGHVQGALLDVFRTEPLPADHPYWTHPRFRITPHISAITRYEETLEQITDKIHSLEQGLPISGVVARNQGY